MGFPGPAPSPPPPPGIGSALRRIGPGIVTGAADMDPAMVLTAIVAGAVFGNSLLWVVLFCIPVLVAVFAVAARIGVEARKGLVDLLRVNYGKKAAMTCAVLIMAINLVMIVADLMAVSDSFSLILRQPRMYFVAAVAFTIWYILIFHDYRRITRALLWLAVPLVAFVGAAVLVAPSPRELAAHTLVPSIPAIPALVAVVALFGSLLTPDVLVWQTSSRREHTPGRESRESLLTVLIAAVVCYCVIIASAAALHGFPAERITTRVAAAALRPLAGNWGEALFAIGIIGSGMVALPIIVASFCYSLSEALGWKSGLSEHPWEAKEFYILISAVVCVGAVGNFLPIDPVRALYWSQILAGAVTVPILMFILVISNDRRIMRTVNTRWENFWIGGACGGLVAAGILLLITKLGG